MRNLAAWFILLAGTLPVSGQTEDFGEAVRRSLDRSQALFPEAARPDSALSRAILVRIEWLSRNDRAYFNDANWPMKLTLAEAAAMGIRPRLPSSPATAVPEEDRRYLAVVTANFSVTGASFRKGQQIILESLQDYKKRGITLVDGQPILLWLDNVRILRELPAGRTTPVVVRIESARYGLPGTAGYSVAGMVQSLIAPDTSGRYEILVSDALLTSGMARRMAREARSLQPDTSRPVPGKVLTVTYTLGGQSKTRQGQEGEMMVLD